MRSDGCVEEPLFLLFLYLGMVLLLLPLPTSGHGGGLPLPHFGIGRQLCAAKLNVVENEEEEKT